MQFWEYCSCCCKTVKWNDAGKTATWLIAGAELCTSRSRQKYKRTWDVSLYPDHQNFSDMICLSSCFQINLYACCLWRFQSRRKRSCQRRIASLPPRYDVFSAAAHVNRPYGALEICRTGGSVVGVGVEILALSTSPHQYHIRSDQYIYIYIYVIEREI